MYAGVVAAVIIGVTWLAARSTFRETDYRDVAGLTITDLAWQPVSDGYRVEAVLVNGASRPAGSVALSAEVHDAGGEVLGINPLINVRNVPAGGRQRLKTFVPARPADGRINITLRPVVVSWKEQD